MNFHAMFSLHRMTINKLCLWKFALVPAVLFASMTPLLARLGGVAWASEPYMLTSPDARTRVEVTEVDGQISYSVKLKDQEVLFPSHIDLFEDGNLTAIHAALAPGDGHCMWIRKVGTKMP